MKNLWDLYTTLKHSEKEVGTVLKFEMVNSSYKLSFEYEVLLNEQSTIDETFTNNGDSVDAINEAIKGGDNLLNYVFMENPPGRINMNIASPNNYNWGLKIDIPSNTYTVRGNLPEKYVSVLERELYEDVKNLLDSMGIKASTTTF